MRVLLAGATGLIGAIALEKMLAAGIDVIPVGRRPTGKVAGEIVTELDAIPTLPDATVAVCCLGTTRAKAGSREAFRKIDHDAVLAFAQKARAAGAKHFIVVTAVGADPRAGVFYSRVKGEVEQALEGMQFERLDILQPGLLLGERLESRPTESFFQAIAPLTNLLTVGSWERYGAIDGADVADAIIGLAKDGGSGVHRLENTALRKAARAARA